MKRNALVVVATLFLLVSGCLGEEGQSEIHSNLLQTEGAVPSGPALVAEVSELSQAPEAYAGSLVQVTGQYRRAPLIVCDGISRLSPVSWLLVEGERQIGARGFEHLVEPLLPPGLTVTVQGVWRHWRGPVGCGKDAPVRDVWHLVVTDFVAPSPVARVTLTPVGQTPRETVQPEDEVVTPSPTGPEPVGTPVSATNTSTATAVPSATPRSTTTSGAATPTASSTSIPEETPTSDAGTASSTATPAEGQATATAATGTATVESAASPTATSTSASGQGTATATTAPDVEDRGSLGYQDLRGGHLDENETHSWQFDVRSGDVITISVAAKLESDIELVVLDPAGNRIVDQNQSPAGQIERIASLRTSGSGGFRIVIGEASGNPTDYSLLLLNNNYAQYYHFEFAGVTSYGNSRSSSMEAENDHFWFFFGNNGEVVNVNLSPTDNSDLFFDLYGTEGEVLEEFVNDAGPGGAEQLMGYQLPATGMYGIRVGELAFESASYTILVARN